jgi:SAM-dependent methyltransferase
MNVSPIRSCRACGSRSLISVFSLGKLYVSNFIGSKDKVGPRIPLDMVLCDASKGGCGLLQLRHTTPRDLLYRRYWYKSGISSIIRNDLRNIVGGLEKMVDLQDGDLVVDIGCNDGTLLRFYDNEKLLLVGFEPAENLLEEAKVGTTRIFNTYFNLADLRKEFGDKKARIVTAISMFYDLDDPNGFLRDVAGALDNDGIFVVQQNYLPAMLQLNAIDNVCHEHLAYYSLATLERLLVRYDLEIFDVKLTEINGGSFRTYVRHKGGAIQQTKQARLRVREIRAKEDKMRLVEPRTYERFKSRICRNKRRFLRFMRREVRKGKRVYIYGASTRGNTAVQFFGLDNGTVVAAVDKNPEKWGRKMAGSRIPIVSPDQYRMDPPDLLLVLPWHLLEEIRAQERSFLDSGGKLVTVMPTFRVISK